MNKTGLEVTEYYIQSIGTEYMTGYFKEEFSNKEVISVIHDPDMKRVLIFYRTIKTQSDISKELEDINDS